VTPLLWLALACGEPPNVPSTTPEGPVAVRVALDGPVQKGGGALRVVVDYDPTGQVDVPAPVAQGVTFEADGEPRVERIGGRDVVTQRYVFRSPSGSYEIAPLDARWTAPDGTVTTGQSGAVFVDVGVEPPRPAEIADIVEPDRVRVVPWLAASLVGVVVAGGLWYAFRPRRVVVAAAPPPVPPDVLALTAWDQLRADPAVPLDDKAVQLAELFRVYVEAVLGFEATARTTLEVVEHLESLRHLPDGNVARARRILRATDRVKFAEERPGAGRAEAIAEWLGELDADLRGFVDSTRPVGLSRAQPRRSA
jgi:hypothetical protein